MEQSGEAPEPEQPAAQPADDGPDGGRAVLVVGILVLVAVIGIVAWMAHGDDALDAIEREQARFPSPTTTTSAPPATEAPPSTGAQVATTAGPATAAPGSTVAPTTTAAPGTASPTTVAPTTSAAPGTDPGASTTPGGSSPATVPGSSPPTSEPEAPPYVAQLVPSVAAFPELLATPEETQKVIDDLLATGRHDIAAPDRTATICAAVPMDQPLALAGRWERDGRRIATSDLTRRDAPGYGECLDDDGDILETGAYQYIASDSEGRESAAGGIVLGAALVEQRFANDGAAAICTIRIAPSTTRYFEAYVFDAAPIAPGANVTLRVAAVEQDVQTLACDGTVLASFSFTPDAEVVQPLDP